MDILIKFEQIAGKADTIVVLPCDHGLSIGLGPTVVKRDGTTGAETKTIKADRLS